VVSPLVRSTGVASSKKVPCEGWFVLRARMDALGLNDRDGPVGVDGRGSSVVKSCIVGIAQGLMAWVRSGLSTAWGWSTLREGLHGRNECMQAIEASR
jgi:hypothetical protein